MEDKFFLNAVYKGRSSNAIKLGTVLTLGRFWVRPSGCHTIYRGQDSVMDYDNVQAVMDIDDTSVSIDAQALPASTIWDYRRRQCSDCGLESGDSPGCIVVVNADGDIIGNSPNAPRNLRIEQVAGGKLRLRWRYFATNQEIAATGFKVYMDSGAGFDFDSPLATVSYNRKVEFTWLSETLTHGALYSFVVRSYATDAGESNNSNKVSAIADSQGPTAATGLSISWEEN